MTHYETLGVTSGATEAEVKRAFRRLSLELHPDRSTGTQERYTKVVEAYNVIGDAEKRRLYDVSLRDTLQPRSLALQRHRSSDADVGRAAIYDPYGDQYPVWRPDGPCQWRGYGPVPGNERGRGQYVEDTYHEPYDRDDRRRTPKQLDDIHHTVDISLDESFTGVSVPINVVRSVNGKDEEVRFYVDVPAGTDNGEIIILDGKGHIDSSRHRHSNIRVRVSIDRHALFRRDGLNIVYSLEITLKEALCGFRKEIAHLDGKTYMVSSERGRVVGHGGRRVIPDKGFRRGMTSGNLVIVFSVVMPRGLTHEQLDVLEKVL